MPKLARPQGKRNIAPSPKDKKATPIKVKEIVTEQKVKSSESAKTSKKTVEPIEEDVSLEEELSDDILNEETSSESEDEADRIEFERSIKELDALASGIEVSEPSITQNKKLNIEKPLTREDYLKSLKQDLLELLKDDDFKKDFTKALDLAVQTLDTTPQQKFNYVVSQNELFLKNLVRIFESFETETSTGFKCNMIDSHFQDFPSFSFGLLNRLRPDIDIIDEAILRYLKDNHRDLYGRYVKEESRNSDSIFSGIFKSDRKQPPFPNKLIVSDRLRRLKDPITVSRKEWVFVSILNEEKNSIIDFVLIPTKHETLFDEYMRKEN